MLWQYCTFNFRYFSQGRCWTDRQANRPLSPHIVDNIIWHHHIKYTHTLYVAEAASYTIHTAGFYLPAGSYQSAVRTGLNPVHVASVPLFHPHSLTSSISCSTMGAYSYQNYGIHYSHCYYLKGNHQASCFRWKWNIWACKYTETKREGEGWI